MTSKFRNLLLLGAAGASMAQIAAADILTGTVTDQTGEATLEGAILTLEELGRSVSSNRFGEFRFAEVPAGEYTLTASYIGTDTVTQTVTVDGNSDFTVVLGQDVRYLDNILVVGSAAAQAGAINQQRASDSLITVIDSDGLGNFPDTTVADSLQRAVGISIETDQGEGRYVSIRGINTDLVSASINGVRTPSPEDRRGVLLDGVPSDLLDGIEIKKSLTPDVDADTLGGVINLKTISAFDRDGRFMRVKLEGRYNEISTEITPKATFTWSDTFGDKLGAAISLNYQSVAIESHNNEAGGWGEDGGVYYLDDDYEQRWYDLTRDRYGLVANFDYRPTENTELYLRTLINEYRDDEVRNKFEFRDLDDVEDDGTILSNGIELPINEMDAEVRQREEKRQIQTISLGGETFMDAWTINYEASYAYAEEDDSDNHDVTFRAEDLADFAGNLLINTSSAETPAISGDAVGAIYNPANYVLDEFEEEFTTNEDEEFAVKFDVSRDSFINGTPVVWKAGVKLRDREKTRDANKNLYSGDDISLSDFVSGYRVTDWRLANPMPRFPDPDLTAALRGGNGGLEFEPEDSAFESLSEDFVVEEQILALYGMGTFDLGPLTLVAGLRFEQTETDLTGNLFTEGGVVGDETVFTLSNDYDHVLPSVNAKYAFNDKLIGRAAYYASVVRPSFEEVAPFIRLNEYGPEDEAEAEIGNPTLDPYEADNFDLSLEYYPTKLSLISAGVFFKQIDNPIYETTLTGVRAVELGILDPAAVDPELIDGVFTEEEIDGEDIITNNELNEVATFINVDQVDLLGFEFNYVQQLDFLGENFEGFLVSANATFTDSEATLPEGREVPFLKQADTVWNLAAGYDKGPWDIRVSANYRSEYLDSLEGEDLDRYTDERLLVEASAKYDVSDQLQVYLEGKNLTDEPEYYYFGNKSRLSQYDEFGTTVVFGARYTY